MVTNAMQTALVTVTYNSAEALRTFWGSVSGKPYEWIVVDNGSSDDSVKIARELGARVVPLPRNVGFSAANNVGVAVSDADVLIFCNPDVTVSDEGVEMLSRKCQVGGGIWAPQLTNPDGTDQENGRGTPFVWRKVKHLLRIHDDRYVKIARAGQDTEVAWLMGAAVAMRRADFEKIAGWDSGFFVYYEDADICLRALELGLRAHVAGDVRWVHGWARETGHGLSLDAWKHEIRSAARFYRKHPYCVVPLGAKSRELKRIDGAPAGAVAHE